MAHPYIVTVIFLFYDLLQVYSLYLYWYQAATHAISLLNQSKVATKHKIKILQQQLRRNAGKLAGDQHVVDWSSVPNEEDAKTEHELRGEIALMEENNRIENDRLSELLRGCGRGRGKSREFEFAARTILATGCSARS